MKKTKQNQISENTGTGTSWSRDSFHQHNYVNWKLQLKLELKFESGGFGIVSALTKLNLLLLDQQCLYRNPLLNGVSQDGQWTKQPL